MGKTGSFFAICVFSVLYWVRGVSGDGQLERIVAVPRQHGNECSRIHNRSLMSRFSSALRLGPADNRKINLGILEE